MRSSTRSVRKSVSKRLFRARSRGRDAGLRRPRFRRSCRAWSNSLPAPARDPMGSLQVFCDLDGVLADFDRGVAERTGRKPRDFSRRRRMWRKLAPPNTSDFFGSLPWMNDGATLWNFLEPLSPVILSGAPSGSWAAPQKRQWCQEHLKLPDDRIHIVDACDKALFSHPRAILVDDWIEHRGPWEARGGIFIHYTSAKKSIALLSGVLRHLTGLLPQHSAAAGSSSASCDCHDEAGNNAATSIPQPSSSSTPTSPPLPTASGAAPTAARNNQEGARTVAAAAVAATAAPATDFWKAASAVPPPPPLATPPPPPSPTMSPSSSSDESLGVARAYFAQPVTIAAEMSVLVI